MKRRRIRSLKEPNTGTNARMKHLPAIRHLVALNKDRQSAPRASFCLNNFKGTRYYDSELSLFGGMERDEQIRDESTVQCVYNYEDKYRFARILRHESLVFNSHFESGNLQMAYQVVHKQEYKNFQEYDLLLHNDVNSKGNTRQWFYFSVANMKPGTEVKFNIINMSKSDSLFNSGQQPLLFSQVAAAAGRGWHHVGYNIRYVANDTLENERRGRKDKVSKKKRRRKKKKKSAGSKFNGQIVEENLYTLTFTYRFEDAGDVCYFAHSYPYTYSDLMRFLRDLEKDRVKSLNFRRTTLCQTLAQNDCDMFTITAPCKDEQEALSRPAIVLTGRAHPGEANGSWVMKGVLQFLTSEHEDAKKLRKFYVFKVVPMMNPDGVINGNYRHSMAGLDLNRNWNKDNPAITPTITAVKQMISRLSRVREVLMVIDIHGHSRKEGVFMYGCVPDARWVSEGGEVPCPPPEGTKQPNLPQPERNWRIKMFPRIMSKLNPHFLYEGCSFTMRKAKLGSMRINVHEELGIIGSYTCEASFCGINGRHFSTGDLERMGATICSAFLEFRSCILTAEDQSSSGDDLVVSGMLTSPMVPDSSKVSEALKKLEMSSKSAFPSPSQADNSENLDGFETDPDPPNPPLQTNQRRRTLSGRDAPSTLPSPYNLASPIVGMSPSQSPKMGSVALQLRLSPPSLTKSMSFKHTEELQGSRFFTQNELREMFADEVQIFTQLKSQTEDLDSFPVDAKDEAAGSEDENFNEADGKGLQEVIGKVRTPPKAVAPGNDEDALQKVLRESQQLQELASQGDPAAQKDTSPLLLGSQRAGRSPFAQLMRRSSSRLSAALLRNSARGEQRLPSARAGASTMVKGNLLSERKGEKDGGSPKGRSPMKVDGAGASVALPPVGDSDANSLDGRLSLMSFGTEREDGPPSSRRNNSVLDYHSHIRDRSPVSLPARSGSIPQPGMSPVHEDRTARMNIACFSSELPMTHDESLSSARKASLHHRRPQYRSSYSGSGTALMVESSNTPAKSLPVLDGPSPRPSGVIPGITRSQHPSCTRDVQLGDDKALPSGSQNDSNALNRKDDDEVPLPSDWTQHGSTESFSNPSSPGAVSSQKWQVRPHDNVCSSGTNERNLSQREGYPWCYLHKHSMKFPNFCEPAIECSSHESLFNDSFLEKDAVQKWKHGSLQFKEKAENLDPSSTYCTKQHGVLLTAAPKPAINENPDASTNGVSKAERRGNIVWGDSFINSFAPVPNLKYVRSDYGIFPSNVSISPYTQRNPPIFSSRALSSSQSQEFCVRKHSEVPTKQRFAVQRHVRQNRHRSSDLSYLKDGSGKSGLRSKSMLIPTSVRQTQKDTSAQQPTHQDLLVCTSGENAKDLTAERKLKSQQLAAPISRQKHIKIKKSQTSLAPNIGIKAKGIKKKNLKMKSESPRRASLFPSISQKPNRRLHETQSTSDIGNKLKDNRRKSKKHVSHQR